MKNNGGWGLRAELAICLVLTIFFGIAVVLIGRVVNTLNEDINMNSNNNSETVEESKDIIINENNKKDESNIEVNKEADNQLKEEVNVNFNSLEDKLVSAGVMYANKYYKDSKLTVTVVRLKTEGILNDLSINDIKCSGYIEIEKGDSFKYYPYIKCGNLYQTKGYDKLKDNLDN